MQNIFDRKEADELIQRINNLTPETKSKWGKMSVDQMLAHCNVSFDIAFTDKYPKPGGFKKFLLRLFVKRGVVGQKPYPKNGRTAPEFIITGEQDFEAEKQKVIKFINTINESGEKHFKGRVYPNFGKLTANEWNVMFAKHLDHHLTQFGT